jgi:hypothetical protein
MNNGMYGFPNPLSNSTIIDIKEFDSSGTYVIPHGSRRLWIQLWGAGCGGGGGARQGSAVNTYGGGGGGGGSLNSAYYLVESLGISGESAPGPGAPSARPGAWGKTLTVVIGAGGTGGAGGASDTSNGSPGGRGGDSWVFVTGSRFSSNGMISAYGGANYSSPFGGGGTTTTGAGGTPASVSVAPLINGLSSAQTSTTYSWNGTSSSVFQNASSITVYSIGNNGGAGGGGIRNDNVAFNGGGISYFSGQTISVVSNPLISGVSIKTGGSANSAAPSYLPTSFYAAYGHGFGGAGGGSGTSTNGSNGEDGWRGGGGGGGGASRNGFIAGNGGKGGDGYCLIVALR